MERLVLLTPVALAERIDSFPLTLASGPRLQLGRYGSQMGVMVRDADANISLGGENDDSSRVLYGHAMRNFRSYLRRGEGLLRHYKAYYGINWQECLRSYACKLTHICEGIPEGELHKLEQRLVEKHIRKGLLEKPRYLTSSDAGYQYRCSEHLPYRDQLIWAWALFSLGTRILEWRREPRGATPADAVLSALQSSEAICKGLTQLYGKQADCFLVNTDLAPRILTKSWKIAAVMCNVGKVCENGDLEEYTASGAATTDILRQALDKRKAIPLIDMLLLNCQRKIQTFDIPEAVAIHLARLAIQHAHGILERVRGDEGTDFDVTDEWRQNPLGAFLAACMMMAELPSRICWRSDDATNDLVCFMPVSKVQLARDGAVAELVYSLHEENHPSEVQPHDFPLGNEDRLFIEGVLSAECLGLLTDGEDLRSRWCPPVGLEKARTDMLSEGNQYLEELQANLTSAKAERNALQKSQQSREKEEEELVGIKEKIQETQDLLNLVGHASTRRALSDLRERHLQVFGGRPVAQAQAQVQRDDDE